MKKSLTFLFILGLIVFITVGCTSNDNNDNSDDVKKEDSNDDESSNDASSTSSSADDPDIQPSDELIEAAKDEGEVVVYSATSRIKDAAKSFEKKYGITVDDTNIDGSELITKVAKEGENNASKADVLLAQEAARVKVELVEPGYAEYNVPEAIKDVIPEEYQDPLSVLMVTKSFIYNSETFDAPPIKNIWELTEPEWKGKFFFTDPYHEGVNMNFLTMVTKPEIADEIEAAYERYFGEKMDVTEENAGYQWIKELFENDVVLFKDENQLNEAIGKKGKDIDAVSLYVHGKLRDREEKDLALMPITGVDPFSGFYYPTLLLQVTDSEHPNAAELFMDYLFTQEGYEPWNTGIGTYSSNPNIRQHMGDLPFDMWSEILVGEDGDYISKNLGDVEDFFDGLDN